MFFRAAFWRRLSARWWTAFRDDEVRRLGASVALRRATRVDWWPEEGS